MQKISDRFVELMNLNAATSIRADCWQVALTLETIQMPSSS